MVEGTDNGHGGGSVYALDGASGRALWRAPAPGEVMGGAVAAQLEQGQADVVVVGTGGAEVLDGRSGGLISQVGRFVGFQNSALPTSSTGAAAG